MKIPDEFQADIQRVVTALRANGAQSVYFFGSLATGSATTHSDIDLAVTGLPAARFFEIYSRVAKNLYHQLDLIDLDHEVEFAAFLKDTDRLVQIA